MQRTIERTPLAPMTLVQVLRAVEMSPVEEGMTVESLACATLRSGPGYRTWLGGNTHKLIDSRGVVLALSRISQLRQLPDHKAGLFS